MGNPLRSLDRWASQSVRRAELMVWLVVIGLAPPRDRLRVTLRYDLPDPPEAGLIADMVAHARRFGLKLVAITAKPNSTLANAADVTLLLPAAAEACPMGLAPTTSTTMQMALGGLMTFRVAWSVAHR